MGLNKHYRAEDSNVIIKTSNVVGPSIIINKSANVNKFTKNKKKLQMSIEPSISTQPFVQNYNLLFVPRWISTPSNFRQNQLLFFGSIFHLNASPFGFFTIIKLIIHFLFTLISFKLNLTYLPYSYLDFLWCEQMFVYHPNDSDTYKNKQIFFSQIIM